MSELRATKSRRLQKVQKRSTCRQKDKTREETVSASRARSSPSCAATKRTRQHTEKQIIQQIDANENMDGSDEIRV